MSNSEFRLRSIHYNGSLVKIISQNINGPCPILAIANVLILNGKLKIPQQWEQLLFQTLAELLAEFIVTKEVVPGNVSEILDLIPKLERGLDVNVHFNKCDAFEFTAALSVFDICDVNLYHGWVIPPSDIQAYELIARTLKSYNAVVECIVRGDGSKDDEVITKAAVCDEFLKQSASQLTNFGILEILSTIPEDRPSILFRNNHFSTLIMRDSKLYTLVTDEGLISEQRGKDRPAVWESLDSVNGGSSFYDANFVEIAQLQDPELPTYRQSVDGLDPDMLIAMQIQEEEDLRQRAMGHLSPTEASSPGVAISAVNRLKKSNSSSSSKDKCILM